MIIVEGNANSSPSGDAHVNLRFDMEGVILGCSCHDRPWQSLVTAGSVEFCRSSPRRSVVCTAKVLSVVASEMGKHHENALWIDPGESVSWCASAVLERT